MLERGLRTFPSCHHPNSGSGIAEDLGRMKRGPAPGRQGTAQPNPSGNMPDSPKDIWSWDESSWAQGPGNYPWDGWRGKFGAPGMCQG